MAVLSGFIDGNVVRRDVIASGLGVDSFLLVHNNGPKVILITVTGNLPIGVQPLNSQVFFVPAGTQADFDADASTGTYQLAVPG